MIKGLLKDTVVYGLSKYLGVFAAIFLMPIYTRLLSKVDYGIMEIVNSWNNFVIMLIPLGLSSSVIRFYEEIKSNPYDKKRYLGSMLSSLIVISGLYTIVMLLFKSSLAKVISESNDSNEIYMHSIWIAISAIFISHFLTILQAKFHKYRYLIVSLTNLMVLVILGFIFVYYQNMGIVGFFRASSIASIISLVICLIFTKNELYLHIDKKALKIILNYSLHILSVGILFNLVNLLDRFIISEFIDLSNVGIYSIGVRISSIMGLAISSFALAWFPLALKIKDEQNSQVIYQKIHKLYFTVSAILLSGLILSSREIISLFAPDYNNAYFTIVILGTYLVLNGSIYFYSLGLHITKKTKYLTTSAVAAIITNIVVSISLVSIMGISGVALGTLSGTIIWVAIQLYYSQKMYFIKYNYKSLITFLLSSIVVTISTVYIDSITMIFSITGIVFKAIFIISLSYLLIRINLRNINLHDIKSIFKKTT